MSPKYNGLETQMAEPENTQTQKGITVFGGRSSLGLQYGDIINITAPSNEKINGHTFFVDYIDRNWLRCVDIAQPEERYSYKIVWDEDDTQTETGGYLIDTSIEQISLISRGEDLGYVKINRLEKGDTLSIEWALPQMPTIRAKIQDIVLDAIEIVDLETRDVLYIDFEYKGLPEYIEKIRVIPAVGIEGPLDEPVSEYVHPNDELPVEVGQSALQLLSKQGDAVFREIVSMDDVAEDLDAVEMEMEIPESQQRYTIDVQIEDISDHLYSRQPKHLHTPEMGIEIATQINRFVELRQEYSEFQENGIILLRKTGTRPLLNRLIKEAEYFPYKVFTPVVQIQKKVYVDFYEQQEELLENDSFKVFDDNEEIGNLESAWEKYKKNVQQGDENRLVHMLHSVLPIPFVKPSVVQRSGSLFFTPVKTRVPQEFWIAQENDPSVSLHLRVINSSKSSESSIYDINTVSYAKQRFLQGEDYYVSAIYVPNLKTIMDAPNPTTPFFRLTSLPSTPQKEDVLSVPLKTEDEIYAEYDERVLLRFKHPGKSVKKREDPPLYGSKPACFYLTTGSLEPKAGLHLGLLQAITPTTSYLLEVLKHEGVMDDVFSFQQAVEKMSGWAVNAENIRKEEYGGINSQIEKNIRIFMKEWRTRSGEWLKRAQQVFAYYKPVNVRWNNLYGLFSSSPEGFSRIEQLSNAYQIQFDAPSTKTENENQLTNSEIVQTILSVDNGRLLHLCLISLLLDWLTPEQFLSGIPDISNTGSNEPNRAVLKTLSKKYTSEKQIEKDNQEDAEVWVDDDLLDGNTQEWMRKFEPVLKRAKTEAEKREIVFQTLTDVDLMSPEIAENMTTTILTGKKRVEDGQYAVLENVKRATYDDNKHKDVVMSRQYYKRIQGIWRHDKSLKDEDFGEDIDNLLSISKKRNQSAEIKQAIQFEFERRYSKIAETMKEQIDEDIKSQIQTIVKKREWTRDKTLSLNRKMTKYADMFNEEKGENPNVSPYASLRDLVLSQTNEPKRQYDIVRFFQQYCRKATLTENQNWGYCLLTNTRLFPVSIYELAVVYNTGKTRDYKRKLDQICSTHGVISDDGGSWVDKESGYTIRQLEHVADGSDTLEYRRLAVAEQELREAEIQAAIETLFEPTTETGVNEEKNDVISVLFRFLNKQAGIQEKTNSPLFNEINVLYQTTIIDPRIIISEKKYKATLAQKYAKYSTEELANKIRSEPPYDIYVDRMRIYVAVSSYFAIMQLNRGKIKRSNTVGPSGCPFSLKGYPQTEDPEKDEGIRFMACLLKDTAKIDERPWKSMNQQSQTVMVKNIKIILQNMMSNTPSLKNALKALEEQGEELETGDSILEQSHKTWAHFLPPIIPFSVKNLIRSEQETHRLYLDDFAQSRKNKEIYRHKLNGLGSLLAYGIVERINDVVSQKKMLMKTRGNVPFLENTCCDDNNRSRNPAFYFCQEDPTLLKYIQHSRQLNQDIKKISFLSRFPMLFYRGLIWTTTFQTSSPVIQESTIKNLFIHFLYDKGLWKRTDIQAIYSFPAPPEDYNREWTPVKKMAMFQEKIEQSGKWTEIRPLYRRFIQKMNQDRIKNIRQEQDPVNLRLKRQEIFGQTLEILGQTESQSLYGRLLEELQANEGHTPLTVKQVIGYRKPLLVHLETNGITIPARFLTAEEDGIINKNSIAHFKNMLNAFTTFLPYSILQNRKNDKPKLPPHWVFTDADFDKLSEYIKKNTPFYKDGRISLLIPLFETFTEKASVLQGIVSNIPEEMFSSRVIWHLLSYLLTEVVYLHLETFYEINTVSSSQNTEMKNVLKDYLTTTLEKMDKMGSHVEMSYETIRRMTQMDADTEKNVIKQYLKEMTNEERKVENEMKKHKLGRWNVGKEIFIYDKRKQGVGFEAQIEEDEPDNDEIVLEDEEAEENAEDGYDVDEGYDDNGDENDDYYD